MRRLFAFLCVLAAATALAGERQPKTVDIDTRANMVSGGFGGSRNNPGDKEEMDCTVTTLTDSAYLYCGATDARGNRVWCTSDSSDPQFGEFVKVLTTINDNSFLRFQWNPSSKVCDFIEVFNGSPWEPKKN